MKRLATGGGILLSERNDECLPEKHDRDAVPLLDSGIRRLTLIDDRVERLARDFRALLRRLAGPLRL